MRLSDLLVLVKLVTRADIERAVGHQQAHGGRIGDNLVTIGAISREALDHFISQIPPEPIDLQATGINPLDLLNLLLKQMYTARLESTLELITAMKLPPHIVDELLRMAVSRNLLVALGNSENQMRYGLSEQGRRWAQESLQSSQYTGPAPVPLEAFCARVKMQKLTNDHITADKIRGALTGYDVTDEFIRKIGPALNSGRSMLMYGPPGNGKTTVALSFAEVFSATVFVPYAVMIEGQVMRVYDPSVHVPLRNTNERPTSMFGGLQREQIDERWVPVRRPFVVTGGELTLEMLDLTYDANAGFYEAPLHIKALGGCFVIDDFGRQIVSPANLLNRWIVPMESRLDYLKLHTGKSFSIPFEAFVIFSTNLDPEDLMDPAFLRRLPYKIEVSGPNPETYRTIFFKLCAQSGIAFSDEIFAAILHKVTQEKRLALAAFQPKFIIDQVIAISRFIGVPPKFDLMSIDYALDNLKVKPQV